jgi:hypothetical protein
LKNRGYEFEFAGDPPAVSRLVGDWATELLLPMLPSVCFGTGRFTQTQSSWTGLRYCSRKWMSGPTGARVLKRDRRLQFNSFYPTLRELLSEGKSPFSLDSYLSWMSPGFLWEESFDKLDIVVNQMKKAEVRDDNKHGE